MDTVDARPPDHPNALRWNSQCGQGVAVLRVLDNDPTPSSTRRKAQRDAQRWPPQSRGKARSREPGTQTHNRIYRDRSTVWAREGPAQGYAAEQYRFQRNMMDEVGLLGAVEPRNFGNCPSGANEPVPAPAPADRAQRETLVTDSIAMRAHAGCDYDIKAGGAGGARHRQTMRAEVPILCRQKEELWPPARSG